MTHARAEELSIDGLVNARDLGGLRTADGHTIRSRQVIRSDNPKGLTEQGQEDLSDLVAPALVVDLRMVLEVAREGYTIGHDPARVVNLPMLPQSGVTPEQIEAAYPGLLSITGPQQYESVLEAVHRALPPIHNPHLDLVPPQGIKLTPRHYAYLKISEGCNHRCTFCIIPSMRGDLVSRPVGDVLNEAQALVNAIEALSGVGAGGSVSLRARRQPRLVVIDVEEGKRLLRESGLNFATADSMGEAASAVVALAEGKK